MEKQCCYFNNCNHIDCECSFCLRRYKLDALFSLANLSEKQRKRISLRIDEDGTDLEEFTHLSSLEKNILEFVENGSNLYIHSSQCGNGKSSWAIRLIQAYINRIWHISPLTCRALFINTTDFLQKLKSNLDDSDYINELRETIKKADLVVWDDIAIKQQSTSFELETLLSLIDYRHCNGKSNIYTSNNKPAEISASLGERLASRICFDSIDIELKGTCKRGLGGNE